MTRLNAFVEAAISSDLTVVDLVPPIELVPVLDVWSLEDCGERPPGLAGFAHLVRLDHPSSLGCLRRVVIATRPPDKPGLSLDGGYALVAGGKVLFTPQCCGDLGTLSDWDAALHDAGTSWSELWIGHPCLAFRRDGDGLLLQGYVEPGEAGMCPLPEAPLYRLKGDDLAVAIAAAGQVCRELAPPLTAALAGGDYPQPLDVIVTRLLGLDGC